MHLIILQFIKKVLDLQTLLTKIAYHGQFGFDYRLLSASICTALARSCCNLMMTIDELAVCVCYTHEREFATALDPIAELIN